MNWSWLSFVIGLILGAAAAAVLLLWHEIDEAPEESPKGKMEGE